MRPPGCDKTRSPLSEEGDAKKMAHVPKHGTSSWSSCVPKKSGVRKCGKSCKVRWTNHLRPELKQESFTAEEEDLIIKLHSAIGSRWSIIAQQLPGRTDNEVKNYWNTSLKKKLIKKGIDPITHRPFSHLLRDYVNIGGTSSPGNRIGPINRELRSTGICFEQPQLGLLAQLQSIKLVTETTTSSIGGCSSSSSSFFLPSPPPSSSSSSSATSSSESMMSFGWSEFLLEDVVGGDMKEEEEDEEIKFKGDDKVVEKMKGLQNEINYKEFQASLPPPPPPPPAADQGSFVEAMLKRDREMYFMEFPHLWEDPHY